MKHQIILELNDKEKKALDELCLEKDLDEQRVMRLALAVFQSVDFHMKRGHQVFPKNLPRGCMGDD